MKLGLFTPVFGKLSLDEMLKELTRFPQITALELGTGGWPGSSHVDLESLLSNPSEAILFRQKLLDHGLSISALSCHGNPLHPQIQIAQRDDATFRKTVRLAELLEVPVVVTFSGCPGGAPEDRTPNWIVVAWPPEYSAALSWQWEERLYPYWTEAAAFATACGVKVALEAHPGFSVYNPETLLRLRAVAGSSLGINLDPSHLWWQGIDILTAISALGDAIFHVHAKDVFLNRRAIDRNGVLDTKGYDTMRERAWTFRSVGWGHDVLTWKSIVSSLRLAGYDYVMSIEHEDALVSINEGLRSAVDLLQAVVLREPPTEAWWV
jgi:sugar phosphate isomerase/epimerase